MWVLSTRVEAQQGNYRIYDRLSPDEHRITMLLRLDRMNIIGPTGLISLNVRRTSSVSATGSLPSWFGEVSGGSKFGTIVPDNLWSDVEPITGHVCSICSLSSFPWTSLLTTGSMEGRECASIRRLRGVWYGRFPLCLEVPFVNKNARRNTAWKAEMNENVASQLKAEVRAPSITDPRTGSSNGVLRCCWKGDYFYSSNNDSN